MRKTGRKRSRKQGKGNPRERTRADLACNAGVFWRASILDSNSEEAWGETKMRPRDQTNMAANLRSRAPKH